MRTVWSVLCTVGGFLMGLLTFRYLLDKPETVVNNHYDKIKNKGDGNSVAVENTTQVTNTTRKDKRIEKKIERLQNRRR